MKKVALIYSKNISDLTGVSAVMRSFAENKDLFKKNGIELSVYSRENICNKSQILKEARRSNNLKQRIKSKISQFITKHAKKHSLFAFLKIYIASIRPAKKIVQYFVNQNKKYDIIFIHEIFTCYEYLKQCQSQAKTIFIIHCCGDIYSSYKLDYKNFEKSIYYKYLLHIESRVLSEVDKLGFVAQTPCRNFLKEYPDFHEQKNYPLLLKAMADITKIKPDITLDILGEGNQKKYLEICCIATIYERKGQKFIVEALNTLKHSGSLPDIHFSIVGDGTSKNELQQLSIDYGIEKYITFCGSSNDITHYLSQSDIFILPSMDEGFPISILEAMRASLPIVSTKVGGIPEMLENGVNGIFIDPSTKGVCDFISNINNYDWKAMGEKSYQIFLEKFTVKTMIDSYSSVINQLS